MRVFLTMEGGGKEYRTEINLALLPAHKREYAYKKFLELMNAVISEKNEEELSGKSETVPEDNAVISDGGIS